jgi:hypothetical protein
MKGSQVIVPDPAHQFQLIGCEYWCGVNQRKQWPGLFYGRGFRQAYHNARKLSLAKGHPYQMTWQNLHSLRDLIVESVAMWRLVDRGSIGLARA